MRAAERFEKRQMPSESQPQIASVAESRIKRIRSSLLCRASSLRSPRAVFRKRHGVRCRHRVIGYFLHAPLEASISPTTQKSYEDPGRLPTRMEGLYTATSTQQQCRRSMRNGSVPSTRAARRDEAIATRSPFGFGNRRPDCLWLWCRVLRRAKKRSRETPEQSRIRRTVSLRQTFAGCIHEQFPPPARLSPCAA